MSKPREALATILQARGTGVPHAWQTLRTAHPDLAGHLSGLGEAGWPSLCRAVQAIRKAAVLHMESLVREEAARHGRDAKEAWETVRGAGGAENGGDLGYLWQVAPTAAGRLRDAAADAEAREARAWPWGKRKARAAAWVWTESYLDRGYQKPDSGVLSWLDDFDADTRARVAREHPREAYHTTLEGAAAAWAARWLQENRPVEAASEERDPMPSKAEAQSKTALAILAGIQTYEAARVGTPHPAKHVPDFSKSLAFAGMDDEEEEDDEGGEGSPPAPSF